MSASVNQVDRNMLSREESLEYASLAAIQGVIAGLAGLEAWERATIRKRPVRIFDINGSLLFLDYSIVRAGEVVGTVRTAASRVLGSPIVAQIIGSNSWDYDAAVEQLTPKVRQDYPDWTIVDTRLVCYSYPKLGVMFGMLDHRGDPARLIFDVADFSLIPESPSEAGPVTREGAYAWSFYGSLSEDDRSARLARFNAIDQIRLQQTNEGRTMLRRHNRLSNLVVIVPPPWTVECTRQLQFCSHYSANEARSHHCFMLHGQQVNDYCAVATCQMILCYYRYYYTQDQIAPALAYSAGGGCPPDQSPGYKSLTGNHLDATYDTNATWDKVSKQIDALHPLKSGVPRHARACAGVSSIHHLAASGLILNETSKKLLIYDPWPWNDKYKVGGSVYWEDWDAITHTNYVFTRLKYL